MKSMTCLSVSEVNRLKIFEHYFLLLLFFILDLTGQANRQRESQKKSEPSVKALRSRFSPCKIVEWRNSTKNIHIHKWDLNPKIVALTSSRCSFAPGYSYFSLTLFVAYIFMYMYIFVYVCIHIKYIDNTGENRHSQTKKMYYSNNFKHTYNYNIGNIFT